MGLGAMSVKNFGSDGSREKRLVSVVICVYNAGKYLRPSLLSIVNQTHRNLDILIIDDGSTDGCFASVEDLLADNRIRVFRQTNMSKPVALNRALDQVRGEFYAIQDADDISYPTRIESQLRTLLERPWLAAVFCGNELIINGKSVAPAFEPKLEAECERIINAMHMPALDPTGMYRMSLVGHVRYDVSLRFAEAVDYILRLGEQHPMIVLGQCLYGYRVHENSMTRQDPVRRDAFVAEALKRACARRGLDYAQVFPNGPHAHRRSRASINDNNIAVHFINSAICQRQAGRHLAAMRTGFECVCLRPFDLHYYKALVYALISRGAVNVLRLGGRSAHSQESFKKLYRRNT
jgi:glycosyltransferase involved in cell wall biosynthesis